MKTKILKSLATAFLLLTPCTLFSHDYEYINDEQCVYRINISDLTAEVVNFCGDQAIVSIPASFKYLDDVYTVTEFGYDDFKYNEYRYNNIYGEKISKYNFIDYDKSRSRIVELIVPKTITRIDAEATEKMPRLKNLTIEGDVFMYSAGCSSPFHLWDSKRLENITFFGLPEFFWHARTKQIDEFFYETEERHLKIIDDPGRFIYFMDSIFHADCPSIKSVFFSSPLLKNILPYSTRLNDTIAFYNNKIKNHPYYFTSEKYTPNLKSSSFPISSQQNDIITWYNEQLKSVRKQFNSLYKEMEQLCKKYAPDTYISIYIATHPEFSAQLDSVYLLCRCHQQNKLDVANILLNNQRIEQDCVESMYRVYYSLFLTKEEFMSRYRFYTSHDSFMQEVEHRKYISNQLDIRRSWDLTGCEASDYYFTKDLKSICEEYNISKEWIINKNDKMRKEYVKNGHYFNSVDDFFEAYISIEYKQLLKHNKQNRPK